MERPYSNSSHPFHAGSIYEHEIERRPQPRNGRERRARYRVVKDHQWRIRREVWRAHSHGQLEPLHRDVGVALADFAGLDDGCFPSHETLAKAANCCVKTVQRALQRLKDLGILWWINRKKRAPARDLQTSNLYSFPDRVALRPFVEREADPPPAPGLSSLKNLESVYSDSVGRRSTLGPKYLPPELLDRINPLPNGRKRAREGPNTCD